MVVYGEGRYTCPSHGDVRAGERDPRRLAAGDYDPRCPRCERTLQPVAVDEDTPPAPRNVYAATKVHQEHLCRAFALEHPEVTVAALRYHNVYGPQMPRDTPYAGVASLFRSALERGDAPTVLEDGRQLRDFVHVRDVARANVAALTHDLPVSGAFNVASGHPRSVLDLAGALSAAFGPDAPVPAIAGGWRPGDARHVFASTDRTESVLGFVAEVPFAVGIHEFATAPLRGAPAAPAADAA
jgi:dTDP-L-rhamnose 4-epimerase